MGNTVNNGPKPFSIQDIVDNNNQEAISEMSDVLAGAPISVTLGPKVPVGKGKPVDTFRAPGDPPAPPTDATSAASVQNFSSGMNNACRMFGANTDSGASVFAFMIMLQKIMNNDYSAARKSELADQQSQLALQDNELDMEQNKIGDLKVEAQARYDHAMSAADTEMVLGICSGVAAAASAVGGALGSGPGGLGLSSAFDVIGKVGGLAGSAMQIITAAYQPQLAADKNFGDLQTAEGKKSDQDEIQIDNMKKQINRAMLNAQNSKDDADTARDRRKSGLDNIQKILDILHGMNPQL